ncbi:MAG: methylisocitrate lyase [Thermoplasmata archaeon]|nr:methylisocitrate lyase [Thermoplasmata archaeon]
MSRLRDNVNLGPKGLRDLLKQKYVMAPGVFNGISAIIAERAGFQAGYLSGSGVAGVMGLPDLSVTTMDEVISDLKKIVSISKLPIIVDVDTGFGETINVIRTVRAMESNGAAAIHIEDQELPKKCGHLPGKKLIPEEEMVKKIIAATEARKNPDFMIIARTDARAVEGFEGAVRRGKLYLEAGADMIFIEALQTKDEFIEYAKQVSPLLANMTEFGKSPLLSAKELGEMGYKIIIFPLTAFRASLLTMENIYSELKEKESQTSFIDKLMSRERFYEIIGYKDYEEEDKILSMKKIDLKKS